MKANQSYCEIEESNFCCTLGCKAEFTCIEKIVRQCVEITRAMSKVDVMVLYEFDFDFLKPWSNGA